MTRHENDLEGELREWFKVFFDEAEYNRFRRNSHSILYMPPSYADVKASYEDFLKQLYTHVKSQLQDHVRDWSTTDIEFLFSVPTTWNKLSMIREFRRIAVHAGFGADAPTHTVEISLTEAEAAAINTFQSHIALYSVSLVSSCPTVVRVND